MIHDWQAMLPENGAIMSQKPTVLLIMYSSLCKAMLPVQSSVASQSLHILYTSRLVCQSCQIVDCWSGERAFGILSGYICCSILVFVPDHTKSVQAQALQMICSDGTCSWASCLDIYINIAIYIPNEALMFSSLLAIFQLVDCADGDRRWITCLSCMALLGSCVILQLSFILPSHSLHSPS